MKVFKIQDGYQVITDRPIERSVYFCTEVDDGNRERDLKCPRICFFPKGGKKHPYDFIQVGYFGRTPYPEDILDAMEELDAIGIINLDDKLINQVVDMALIDSNGYGALIVSASGNHTNPDYRVGIQLNGRIGYITKGVYDPSVLYGLLLRLEDFAEKE